MMVVLIPARNLDGSGGRSGCIKSLNWFVVSRSTCERAQIYVWLVSI
jgi:hypothetical protein